MKTSSEHLEQVKFFSLIDLHKGAYPVLENVFAIPNGGKRPKMQGRNGKWFSPVAVKMKAEGVKAGVLDIFCAAPMPPFHGLWIEMKYGKNPLTEEQKDWIVRLTDQGYKCVICYSGEAAAGTLFEYLQLPIKFEIF